MNINDIMIHYDMLFKYLLRILKNENDAKDTLHKTILELSENLSSYRNEGKLEHFLKVCVKYNALHFLKQKNRYKDFKVLNEEPYCENSENSISKYNVNKILEILPNGRKNIFKLKFNEGYNFKEISKMLNITESTVRTQYFRARKTLRNFLSNEFF